MGDPRFEPILDMLIRYVTLDFSQKLELSSEGDELDAVAAGVNSLGEELQHYMKTSESIKQQLEDKNKELEHFAYIASHDLREPLRTMTSFAQLLSAGYGDKLDDQAKTYIRYMTDAAARMEALINGLLEYSRTGRDANLEEVDLSEVVGDLLDDLAMSIKISKAEIVLDKLPVVMGYKLPLRQLVQNLISNALKYRKADVDPVVYITSKVDDGDIEIAVRDNGIGIDPKYHEQVFAIFKRLHSKSKYEGSGLGLAQCQKIVDMHGGKLWVESQPDQGCTFRFTIPRYSKRGQKLISGTD